MKSSIWVFLTQFLLYPGVTLTKVFDTFNGTSLLNYPGNEDFASMNNWGDYWVFNNDQGYGDLWLIGMKKKM